MHLLILISMKLILQHQCFWQVKNIYSNGVALSVLPNSFGGNISEPLMPTLYAGKTYYFAITAYTESEMAWHEVLTWATADMLNDPDGASGGDGIDFTSVQITWQ